MTDTPSISELLSMNDAELTSVLGFDTKLAEFKKSIKDLDTLTGKAREEAELAVKKRLSPSIYTEDFKYIYEDAKYAARKHKQSAKEIMDDEEPASVL